MLAVFAFVSRRTPRSQRSPRARFAAACLTACVAVTAFAPSAPAQCPPPDPAPPTVPLAKLRAGQYNVGMDGVKQFAQPPLRNRWNEAGGGAAGRAAVDAYLRTHPVPVVRGPGGELHLVDNHHRTTGVYTLSVEFGPEFPDYVYYQVIDDLSHLSGAAFWARLIEGGPVIDEKCNPVPGLQHQYLWPYDRGVEQDPNVNPPPMIPGLTDDILRSIASNVRSANGYADFEDDETPAPPFVFFFQEFYWANYLRDLVYLKGSAEPWNTRGGNPNAQFVFTVEPGETEGDAVRRIVAQAALLCREPATAKLPGAVCGPDVYARFLIDGSDLGAVLSGWGTTVEERSSLPTVDVNRDGEVNELDLAEVLAHWGICT
ncbi:MAG: hypothetical protein RL591_1394, partial [Planctomycetota bacterium]